MSLTKASYSMISGAPINVLDYGAVGNGTTDDTTAIQNAINAAKIGNVVYFPPGTYKITAALTMYAGITLQGSSPVVTVFGVHTFAKSPSRIWQATAATSCVQILGNASSDTVCDTIIERLSFIAVQTPAFDDAPQANKHGIYCYGTSPYSAYRSTIANCTFHAFDSAIYVEGYDTGAGVDWQFDSVLIQRNAFFQCNNGIYLNTTNADAWLIEANTAAIPPNGKFLYLQRSGYLTAIANYATPGYATDGSIATGTEMFRLGAFPDSVKMIGNSGSDGLAYFLRIDASVGFENNYIVYSLDTNAIEAPCLIERQCKIVSTGNRFTFDATCTGNDVEIHSYGDSWFPNTTKWLMTGLRPRLFVDPGNTQTSGTTTAATGVATTLFSLPASAGAYQVFAWLANGGSLYQSVATLMCDGVTLARTTGANGASLTITVSGRNVQTTQISGVSQPVYWSYQRVA